MPMPIAFDRNPNIQIQQKAEPEKKEPEKKEWTKEEVDDLARTTLEGLGWSDVAPKKEIPNGVPKKDDLPPTPEPEAPAEPEPAQPPAKPRKEPKPDMADRIAAKISEENEKLVARLQPKPQAQPVPESKAESDPKDDRLRKVFAEMAEMNPTENREFPAKFEEFLKLERSYRQKWEAENPGQAFKAEDDEHASWYEKNNIEYDDDDFHRATTRVEVRDSLALRDQQNLIHNAQHQALTTAESTIEAVSEAIETDVEAKLKELVGDNTILQSEGPIAEKYQAVTSELSDKIRTASLLLTPLSGARFDPKDPVHAEIGRDVREFDADLAALSPADQRLLITTSLGKKSRLLTKKFSPMSEYQQLSEVERGKHWTIATEPVLAAKLMAVQAKEQISGWIDGIFKQVGKKSDTKAATVSPQPQSGATAVAASVGMAKPTPPSLSPSATDVTQQSGAKVKSENSWEEIAKSF